MWGGSLMVKKRYFNVRALGQECLRDGRPLQADVGSVTMTDHGMPAEEREN
jgi:hypothetical protein